MATREKLDIPSAVKKAEEYEGGKILHDAQLLGEALSRLVELAKL